MLRPDYTNGKITLNQAVLRPLIEVISRCAITTSVDDVPYKIVSQNKTFAGKTRVNTKNEFAKNILRHYYVKRVYKNSI